MAGTQKGGKAAAILTRQNTVLIFMQKSVLWVVKRVELVDFSQIQNLLVGRC